MEVKAPLNHSGDVKPKTEKDQEMKLHMAYAQNGGEGLSNSLRESLLSTKIVRTKVGMNYADQIKNYKMEGV